MFIEGRKSILFNSRNPLPAEMKEKIEQIGGEVAVNNFTFGFPEHTNQHEPHYLIYLKLKHGFDKAIKDGSLAAIKFALLNPHNHEKISAAIQKGGIQAIGELFAHTELGTVPIYPVHDQNIVIIPVEKNRFKDLAHLGYTLKLLEDRFDLHVNEITHIPDFPTRNAGTQVVQIVKPGQAPKQSDEPRQRPPFSDQYLIRVIMPTNDHKTAVNMIRNATQGQLSTHFKEDLLDLTTLPGFERVTKRGKKP